MNISLCHQQMIKDCVTPRNTKYQTQKQFLRDSIESAVSSSHTLEAFKKILLEKYRILAKESRGRFSYLHPDRSKPITGRNLGTLYEKEHLIQVIEENNKSQTADIEPAFAILYVKSNLKLVTDLQTCIKAQQNAAYARKVKLSNLKEMAKTVAYIQEHEYDTKEMLENTFSSVREQVKTCRKNLNPLKEIYRTSMSRFTTPDNTLQTKLYILNSAKPNIKENSVKNILLRLPFMKLPGITLKESSLIAEYPP